MAPIFFDTETCGLHGPIVLIQWAEGDGEVQLHEVWTNPIADTLALIEKMTNHKGGLVAFNMAFDWFHICQLYTTLSLLDPSFYPIDHIDEIALLEPKARDGLCLKPVTVCDVMLHARKGPYQSTMERGDIRIKKIPTLLAQVLANELEHRIPLKDIYFARRKNKNVPHWQVFDIEDNPDFKDIVLKFRPSNALKALAIDALGVSTKDLILYGDMELDKKEYPEEIGYAPFAVAVGKPGNWNNAWPDKIKYHIEHWGYNDIARRYAKDDVLYTRGLYEHFGCPEMGDNDSVLSALIGAARWRGYAVNVEKIKELRSNALIAAARIPSAPTQVRKYITKDLSQVELVALQQGTKYIESTKKLVLEEISKFRIECPDCEDENCKTCDNLRSIPHPAAKRAIEVIEARQAKYEIDFYDKLILAGRLHASFVVIGTLSSRMSGSDGLNPQGIKKTKTVRACFPLSFSDYNLCGGDFESFEVVLADACYGDPDLRQELLAVDDCPFCEAKGCKECSNSGRLKRSIHALFGTFVYPGMSYLDILKTKGTNDDKYTRSKSAVFAMLYGGEAFTLKERLGVPIEVAEKAYQRFTQRYRKVGEARRKVIDMFCSMRQLGGIGSKIEWSEPADYIESMTGFKRYFTLENDITRALFQLAENPPKSWLKIKARVVRRDHEQTTSGAVRSALYAAAFALQAANTRAAANHIIQSAGATTTKDLQRRIWELQPSGIQEWYVQPMNIHDEIMVPAKSEFVPQVRKVVDCFIEETKPKVPLIAIDWGDHLETWADK